MVSPSRICRFLPGKHLVITFTLMNLILVLLYKRLAQVYGLEVAIAVEQGSKVEETARSLRDVGTADYHNETTNATYRTTPELNGATVAPPHHQDDVGRFVLEPEIDCRLSDKLLIIYVYSGVDGERRRRLIRTTWADLTRYDSALYNLRLFFVTGSSQDGGLMAAVRNEAATFGDLLVADFVDSPDNGTLRGLNALAWIRTSCDLDRVEFVFKTDDDVFVNLYSLLYDVSVMADGGDDWNFLCLPYRARTSSVQPADRRAYCRGEGYGMSTETLRLVLDNCLVAPPIDDESLFFTSACLRDVFPDKVIRYKSLRRSRCILDPEALDRVLSEVHVQGLANFTLIRPLPDQYWPKICQVLSRLHKTESATDNRT